MIECYISIHVHKGPVHGTPAMNSLYTSGVRQTNSLQADLERLRNGDNSASLLGMSKGISRFNIN